MFCLKKLLEWTACVDLRRTTSRHALQIRPSDRSRPSNRSPAAGAAYAYADPLSYSLKVTPSNHFVNWQQDPQGNWLARFVFPEKATELKIEVDFTAQMTVINPFDFFVEPYADEFSVQLYRRSQDRTRAVSRDRHGRPAACRLSCRTIPREAPSTVDFLVDLNAQSAARRFATSSAWSRASRRRRRRWRSGAGSCRDSAWLLDADPAASRPRRPLRLRLPHSAAVPTSIRSKDRAGSMNDFTDLHAWAEVYLPGRRLDRIRRHLGPADRRGHISARRHAALSIGGADHAARSDPREVEIRLRDERQAHPRSAARSPGRSPTKHGRELDSAGRTGRCRSEGAATCA